MSSLEWFNGDTKEALKQMVERNCVFLIYIGKGDDDIIEVFNDQNIIKLLNNEFIICSKMDPDSQSFNNFKEIFNDIVIPSIYMLEKNNIQQYIIKIQDLKETNAIQLDLKLQVFNAIYNITKEISDKIDVDDDKKKYLQYLTEVSNNKLQNFNIPSISDIQQPTEKIEELQHLNSPNINDGVQQPTRKVEMSNDTTKIKIKVPCQDITILQEFQSTLTLNDVKKFILDNVNLPKKPIKLIAHRQFTENDFCQTLDALNLCPSSTLYVHLVPSSQGLYPFKIINWFISIYNVIILNPYNCIQNYFIRRPQRIEPPKPISRSKKKTAGYSLKSNIHQLKHNNTDDDENNTYNGNSTQQL